MSRRWSEFIRELKNAQRGEPDRSKATRHIATAAVIPTVVASVFVGWWLTPDRASGGELFANVALCAFGAAAIVILLVLAANRWLGFRAVARIGGGLIGMVTGFLIGVAVNNIRSEGYWLFVIAPIGGLVGLFLPLPIPTGPPPDAESEADRTNPRRE